jgi:hypothetical protein
MEYLAPEGNKVVGPVLLTGPPGVGKSYWIEQLAKKNKVGIYSYNCRRDKTLREGRNKLINWVFLKEPCIVWLEGADDLTIEAQSFLRRSLETHSANVFLVLEVRDTSCVADPLRSRCATIVIQPPTEERCFEFLRGLKPVLSEETCRRVLDIVKPWERSYRKMLTYHQVATLFPTSLDLALAKEKAQAEVCLDKSQLADILKWREEAFNPCVILDNNITLHGILPEGAFIHSAWHQIAYLMLKDGVTASNDK